MTERPENQEAERLEAVSDAAEVMGALAPVPGDMVNRTRESPAEQNKEE